MRTVDGPLVSCALHSHGLLFANLLIVLVDLLKLAAIRFGHYEITLFQFVDTHALIFVAICIRLDAFTVHLVFTPGSYIDIAICPGEHTLLTVHFILKPGARIAITSFVAVVALAVHVSIEVLALIALDFWQRRSIVDRFFYQSFMFSHRRRIQVDKQAQAVHTTVCKDAVLELTTRHE